LVFTNLTKEDLESALAKYEVNDFARTGAVAPETVTVEKGPVHGQHGGLMEHTLEPTLRKNGMPTKLNRGVIELLADHVLCREGEHISPQGAILLRLFGHELATFKMDLLCGWVRLLPGGVPSQSRSRSFLFSVSLFCFLRTFRSRRKSLFRARSAVTTTRCGWLRRLATPLSERRNDRADKKRHPFP
jgi:mRNA turnover protein 4